MKLVLTHNKMKTFKKVFILFITFQFPTIIFSQTTDSINLYRKEVIFSKNHISFSIHGSVTTKAKISKTSEKYNVGSSPQPGYEFGLDYHINFNQSYSLIVGIHTGALGRNLEYFISKNEFNPPMQYDIFDNKGSSRDIDLFYYKLPVSVEKRFFLKKMKLLSLNAGLSLLNTPDIGIEIKSFAFYPNGSSVNFFDGLLILNQDAKFWINFHIGGGYAWILKNNNILSANLIANLSTTKFAKGIYNFTIPGQTPVDGSYSLKGSFIGLGVSYTFTGANNLLRKRSYGKK